MNKIPFLLVLSWMISVRGSAQSADSIIETARRHVAEYGPAYAQAVSQKKGTAMSERVIAQVGIGGKNDSIVFHYKGSHYTRFDYNLMQYVTHDIGGAFGLLGFYIPLDLAFALPPFNAHDTAYKVPQYDSLDRYTNWDPTDELIVPTFLGFTVSNQYNAAGSLSYTMHKIYDPRKLYGYYPQTASYIRNKLAKAVTTFYDRTITYQSDDKILLDSLAYTFGSPTTPSRRSLYTYNASDNWVTLSLSQIGSSGSTTIVNTFYPNGQLWTSKEIAGGSLIYKSDSFTYTPGVPGYTGFWEVIDNGAHVEAYQEICVHVNAFSLKDSIVFTKRRDTTVYPSAAYKIEYNANGNPVSKTVFALNGSGASHDVMRWYYEPYDPTVGVENPVVSATSSRITLSPNPTTGAITLNYGTAMPKGPITVAISNTLGQLVYSEVFDPQGNKSEIILGKETAPGIYTISVIGRGNAVLYKSTFLKQ